MKTRWLTTGILCIIAVVIFLVGKINYNREIVTVPQQIESDIDTIAHENILPCFREKTSASRKLTDSLQLVNINDIDSTILVDLKYATTDNFTGIVLYEGLEDACLQPDVARMLAEAHQYLKKSHPGLRLLVYDAVRPLSVQRAMWEHVKDTRYHRYVAHPDRRSLHNYGAAVDLTLADSLGHPLDMGTSFDHFGRAAGIGNEQELVEQGLLNKQQVLNRQLLREVMRYAGFRSISGEWWHFNACSLQEAKQRYTIIEDL